MAPAGTPASVVDALNSAANRSLAVPETRERLMALASPPVEGTPEQFRQHMRHEIDKWAQVIRTAGITAD